MNDNYTNQSERLMTMFVEILARQFPIRSQVERLKIRTPGEFAAQLGIHTNHLNRIVKENTGKTTSAFITEYIVRQSTRMLMHSDWRVAEIAACLGFSYPAHFTKVFKEHIGQTPGKYRLGK